MSVTLAIDAAGDLGSVAARRDDGPVVTRRFGHRRHAAELTPAIQVVLQELRATSTDLSRLIVADGPGSFTGLRIGFATALGLVRARPAIETWVTPALMATAFAARTHAGEQSVVALFDALRGDVYGAAYRFCEQRVDVLYPATCATLAVLAETWRPPPALAVGDGAARYAAVVRQWTGRDAIGDPASGAGAQALLELLDWAGGATRIEDLASHEPAYGRPAEAQARWERARGRPLPNS